MTIETIDANRMAISINQSMKFATIHGDREMLYYNDGIYTPFGEDIIAAELEKRTNGDKITTHIVTEVVNHIKRRSFVYRDAFDSDLNIINMSNGLYSPKTGLSPHTPKYLSLRKSPIIYDVNATCPNIDVFIEDVVEPKRVQTIYEIGGYALEARKNLKTAFIFEGEKNSGKSVMEKLLECMVGIDATTHVSPLTVSRTTYGAAEYYGKQLNLVDDLGNTPIEDTGVLKSVIASGRINAQFKYSQPFDYTPNVLCIFATNEVPTTATIDDAYASRFSIIKFPNLFEGGNDNPDILKTLTTQSELSGFFNKCMDAVSRVRDTGKFTGDDTLADRINAYNYSSRPVTRFVNECCAIKDPEDSISKDELYHAYVEWSKQHHFVSVDKPNVMTSHLKSLGCVVRQLRDNDSRYYAYCGVTLKAELGDW